MTGLLHGWPYAGLLAAVLLLAIQWRERVSSATGLESALRDPAFVLSLLWPMYLVHQFEEHGVDLLGRRFAFLGDICATVGEPDVARCPADAAFIFVVNVVACPMAFVMPLVWRRTRPLLAAFGWSVPLVNAVAHVGTAVVHRAYNPGLLTAAILFVPLGAWMVRVMLAAGHLARSQVPLLFVTGGVLHAVLIGSLLAREHGLIGHTTLLLVNAVNGLVPLGVGLLCVRARSA